MFMMNVPSFSWCFVVTSLVVFFGPQQHTLDAAPLMLYLSTSQLPTSTTLTGTRSIKTFVDAGNRQFVVIANTLSSTILYSRFNDVTKQWANPATISPGLQITSLEIFSLSGSPYVAAVSDTQVKFYKWNGVSAFSAQNPMQLTTLKATDCEVMSIGVDFYAAVTHSFDGTTCETPSKVYKYNSGTLAWDPFLDIPTKDGRDFESVVISGTTYLLVANYKTQAGVYSVNSEVWKWNGATFAFFQSIPTTGAIEWSVAAYGGTTYAFVCNAYSGTTYQVNSAMYKWDPSGAGSFVSLQTIATTNVLGATFFTIRNEFYLMLAFYSNAAGTVNVVNSPLYRYDTVSTSFLFQQNTQTSGCTYWEYFKRGSTHYLIPSEATDGSTTTLPMRQFRIVGISRTKTPSIPKTLVELTGDWVSQTPTHSHSFTADKPRTMSISKSFQFWKMTLTTMSRDIPHTITNSKSYQQRKLTVTTFTNDHSASISKSYQRRLTRSVSHTKTKQTMTVLHTSTASPTRVKDGKSKSWSWTNEHSQSYNPTGSKEHMSKTRTHSKSRSLEKLSPTRPSLTVDIMSVTKTHSHSHSHTFSRDAETPFRESRTMTHSHSHSYSKDAETPLKESKTVTHTHSKTHTWTIVKRSLEVASNDMTQSLTPTNFLRWSPSVSQSNDHSISLSLSVAPEKRTKTLTRTKTYQQDTRTMSDSKQRSSTKTKSSWKNTKSVTKTKSRSINEPSNEEQRSWSRSVTNDPQTRSPTATLSKSPSVSPDASVSTTKTATREMSLTPTQSLSNSPSIDRTKSLSPTYQVNLSNSFTLSSNGTSSDSYTADRFKNRTVTNSLTFSDSGSILPLVSFLEIEGGENIITSLGLMDTFVRPRPSIGLRLIGDTWDRSKVWDMVEGIRGYASTTSSGLTMASQFMLSKRKILRSTTTSLSDRDHLLTIQFGVDEDFSIDDSEKLEFTNIYALCTSNKTQPRIMHPKKFHIEIVPSQMPSAELGTSSLVSQSAALLSATVLNAPALPAAQSFGLVVSLTCMTPAVRRINRAFVLSLSPLYFLFGEMESGLTPGDISYISMAGWNCVLVAGVFLLHLGFTYRLSRKKHEWNYACELAFFPYRSAQLAIGMIPATLQSCFRVLYLSLDRLDLVVGAIAIILAVLCGVIIPIILWSGVYSKHWCHYHVGTSCGLKFILPSGQWVPRNDWYRFGPFYPHRGGMSWFKIYETVSTLILVGFSTWIPQSDSACMIQLYAIMGLYGVLAIMFLACRPERCLYKSVLQSFLALAQAAVIAVNMFLAGDVGLFVEGILAIVVPGLMCVDLGISIYVNHWESTSKKFSALSYGEHHEGELSVAAILQKKGGKDLEDALVHLFEGEGEGVPLRSPNGTKESATSGMLDPLSHNLVFPAFAGVEMSAITTPKFVNREGKEDEDELTTESRQKLNTFLADVAKRRSETNGTGAWNPHKVMFPVQKASTYEEDLQDLQNML